MDEPIRTQGELLHQALRSPSNAIAYDVSRRLTALDPARAVIEGDACSFGLEEYVAAGLCTAAAIHHTHSRITTDWSGHGEGLHRRAENAWSEVFWQGHSLQVLLMTWTDGMHRGRHYWIVAESRGVAERFYQTVCDWCAEVRGEVLVFEGGWWNKSAELFQAIRSATLDNLVLRGTMKQELRDDLAHFFASRALYEEYQVPWKRGILFIGPPGNGKTHAVKALINAMDQPCLYVKSFKSEYQTDHDSIRTVFRRARQTTPCILVLEDLDSLVDEGNRSFFLNELDGFASNVGIVTLATTNHPERLDRSILDRPSRFDRKYHFELPAEEERRAYIALWNGTLQPALRLPEPAIQEIVELTAEFSFAYIKEMFLSSTMRWIATPEPGSMAAIMAAQTAALREQMSSLDEETGAEVASDAEQLARQTMQLMMRRGAAMRRRFER